MLALAIRFLMGAASGALAAFWIALASESAGRNLGVVVAVCSLSCGLLALIPPMFAVDRLNRTAPYILGVVAVIILFAAISASRRLSEGRERCSSCCLAAGYPAMIYAREYRTGPRHCTCSDRTDPQHPRSDEKPCFNAGIQVRWSSTLGRSSSAQPSQALKSDVE